MIGIIGAGLLLAGIVKIVIFYAARKESASGEPVQAVQAVQR